MRNIEKLRNYFLGKDPQLKETMADNSLRLIGIPGREFVLRIELLRRLGELKKELTDKDTELEGLINNLQSALSSETLARQNADRDLSDRITTNANDIAAINQWRNNTDFVLADDLAAALLNYYTKAEVDAIIAAIPTLTYEVVQALPTTNISRRTIYMVHPQGAEEPDYYNEYIYMGDTSQPYDPDNWEIIGNTRIDLTNYYTKAEVDAELAERDDAIEDVADDLDVVAQHLDDVEEEVDDLYDNWPTATATGTTINVQDSSNLPLKDFALGGNATQGADPTPDSPQDIHVVTGDNTVKVVGKNLCNTILTVNLNSGNEKWFNTSLTTENSGIRWENGKTYYIGAFCEKQSNETVQIDNYGYNTIINTTRTITFNGTIPHVRVGANNLQGNVVNEEIKIIVAYNSFTEYEPYTAQTQLLSLGSIELAKIGTYQDRIYKSGGKWWLEKNIGKVVLDGTQAIKNVNWRPSDTSVGWLYYYGLTNNTFAQNRVVGDVKANKLSAASYYDMYEKNVDNGIGGYTDGTFGLVVRVANTSLTTAEAINAYLSTNPITAYYAVETPTTTEITDTTLLGQLENILKMHTNKNVTNISIVPAGTNAEPTAEVEYRVEVKEYNNFTGTDGSSAGTSGLVPAPATTDSGKYLKADGTWGTPSGGGGGTSDYTDLTNKPQINGVVLAGDKTTSDLGIAVPTQTSDLTNDSGFITSADVPTATSELTNDSGFITNAVDNLTNYTPTSSLSAVATSGDYDDLSNKPTVPSITYSTTDLTPGTSQLDTGSFYFVYE